MIPFDHLIEHSGNKDLFQAIKMSIISHKTGYPIHFHVEGLRGTGKTTIIRAAKQVLPGIERIKSCIYNCDPLHPHCPRHVGLTKEEIDGIGIEIIPMPFLEISHSAKIGTVVGSIDLAKLTDQANPEAALLPGIIPRAHRGIVFVDEINRLADTAPELADILLDVMGTKPGRIQIEESGLSTVTMPIEICIWASSNPDEEPGPLEEIRRQLADRFDFTIQMGRPKDLDTVLEIMKRNSWYKMETKKEPTLSESCSLKYISNFSHQVQEFSKIEFKTNLQKKLAQMYLDFNLESMRALEAIQIGGLVCASLKHKNQVDMEDVKSVIPWALRHRVDSLTLAKILKSLNDREEYGEECLEKTVAKTMNPVREKQKNRWKLGFLEAVMNYFNRLELLGRLKRQLEGQPRQSGKEKANYPPNPNSQGEEIGEGSAFINPLEAEVKEFPLPATPLERLENNLVSTEESLRQDKP